MEVVIRDKLQPQKILHKIQARKVEIVGQNMDTLKIQQPDGKVVTRPLFALVAITSPFGMD